MALTFNRNEPGFWLSGAAHVAMLAAGLVAFSSPQFPEAQEGIPVEIVTDNELSQITKGDLSAKEAKPDPKPRVDRVADVAKPNDPGEAPRDAPAPPKRPAEMKVADEPVEAAAAPPPPPPAPPPRPEPAKVDAPSPPKREELKLVEREDPDAIAQARAQEKAEADAKAAAEAKTKALAKAKAEADQKKAMADAIAKAEADEQAKEKAEAAARAKAIKEAKLRADAKAKADAEAKAKKQAELADKFSAGDIRQMLASKEPHQSSGATGSEVNRTASLGTATGNAQRLNPSQRDQLMGLLRDQLHRCWQAPMAAQTADKPPVPAVRVLLRVDGSLAAEPAVLNTSADPLFRVIADSATRATRRCAPLKIPAQFAPYYQDWKDLVVNFDPRDMG